MTNRKIQHQLLLTLMLLGIGVFGHMSQAHSMALNGQSNQNPETAATYDSLFIVGPATPGGWDLGAQTPMAQDQDSAAIFTWSGYLSAGELKFKTYPGDDFCGGDWIHPMEQGQDISETEAEILMGCADDNPDNTWEIPKDTSYSITVSLTDTTVNFEMIESTTEGPVYEGLYLVGSATPGGWDLNSQTPLQQSEEDPYVFSWSGDLSSGEFKIKTYPGDDFCGGEWIHPLEQGQEMSSSDYEILMGCADNNPDNTWELSEADSGSYTITVNLESDSIGIEQTGTTSIDEETSRIDGYELSQNYPNPFNPSTKIRFNIPESGQVKIDVYDLAGNRINTLINERMAAGSHSVTFSSSDLSSGVYIYRLQTSEVTLSRKMILMK